MLFAKTKALVWKAFWLVSICKWAAQKQVVGDVTGRRNVLPWQQVRRLRRLSGAKFSMKMFFSRNSRLLTKCSHRLQNLVFAARFVKKKPLRFEACLSGRKNKRCVASCGSKSIPVRRARDRIPVALSKDSVMDWSGSVQFRVLLITPQGNQR